ncbi:MAG: response regulator transcription factor [Candidatus Omnitrophica bacterium]|nr:response regulator transcription factor [Candidatus Omnitrophota bacterium]
MRILVVEDEKKVRDFVKKGFEEEGHCVDPAADGQEGYFLAEGEKYDCIVLDIMLPKLDGYEVARQLRAKGNKTPIIFLTAKDAVDDRVKGLELGADDYLVKPFAFSELSARVRALLRRGKDKELDVIEEGGLHVDLRKRVVRRDGKAIELTPREFSLLQYLIERKSEVVTRTMLAENVWGYHFDSGSNVIDVHINNLRKKIDGDFEKPLIHTIRGVGYVLEKRD